ncbi:MAG: NAD-dependent epimerase/dehydratase family protein [Candidatus Aenigmarchaeota archaeon]|nr:NAD-dependent epimerase/dehydratase family protein [Candidatus Aenigmarchaeota archaeon]
MKILVTGGCGFIGSHLVDKLITLNHEVVVLDNLSSGKKEYLNPAAKLVVGDVRDLDDVKKSIRGCETVFHLAALTDVRSEAEETDYQVNFIGSKSVFSVAEAINAKIIFASSSAVYGNSPAKEDSKCSPISQYGRSKLKAEKACPEDSLILRLFNAYGPKGKSVINIFCKKIPKYEDITVFGTGLQTRDYIYVADVVNAMIMGLKKSGIYNVGTGLETSLLDVIEIIHQLANNKPNIKFAMPRENEVKRSKADITKIKHALGWGPRIELVEGIRKLLEKPGA